MILKDVFNLLNANLKSMLIIYFLIVIVFGIVELVGIGSLVLFFNLLISENIENSNAALRKIYNYFHHLLKNFVIFFSAHLYNKMFLYFIILIFRKN